MFLSSLERFLRDQRAALRVLDDLARRRRRPGERLREIRRAALRKESARIENARSEATRAAAEVEMAISRNSRKPAREADVAKPKGGSSDGAHPRSRAAHRATAELNALGWLDHRCIESAVEEILEQRKNTNANTKSTAAGAS